MRAHHTPRRGALRGDTHRSGIFRRGALSVRPRPGGAATLALLAVLCALAVWCPPCFATSQDSGSPTNSNEPSIGTLSSRYSTLEELSDTSNAEESVVVDTRVGVLVGANQALDGSTVRFEGEATGEAIAGPSGYKWLSISDTSGQAIAVLVTNAQASAITNYGDHMTIGSTIEVTGVYHMACADDQGELDVHAEQVVVTEAGGATTHPANRDALLAGTALCGVGFVLIALFVLLRRHWDKKQRLQCSERS